MGIGFIIASMGPSNITGVMRFNFGMSELLGGISIVALSMALFAIPQMVMVYGTKTNVAKQDMSGNEVELSQDIALDAGSFRQVLGGVAESTRHWKANIGAGLVGAFAGIIPGMGGFTANFMSYGVARQLSRKKDQFGTGIPEGIIAPEGSSLAKEAGHMIPLLGLAIPGGVGGALFIAALTIQGVRVGFGFETEYPVLAYQVVWIIALSGLIGTIAGVLAGSQLAKVTKIPGPVLVPFLFAMSALGPFLADVSFFSVGEVLVFGVIGLVLRRLKFSLATLVLGLVLGPTFESNIYLIPNVYNGFDFLKKQPFADALFGVAIVILVAKGIEVRRSHVKRRAAEAETLAGVDVALRADVIRRQRQKDTPYPVLQLITTLALVVIGAYWSWYSMSKYDLATGLFATVAGFLVVVPMLFLVPADVRNYWYYRKSKSADDVPALEKIQPEPVDMVGTPDSEDQPFVVGRQPGERDSEPADNTSDDVPVAGTVPSIVAGVAPSTVPSDVALDVRAPAVMLQELQDVTVLVPEPASDVVERSWTVNGQYRREVVAIAWLAGLIVGCYVIGFTWAIPVFMFAYGMTSCSDYFKTLRGRVIFSVLSAAGLWLVTWLMMDAVLHLPFTPLIAL